jgi:hypothetical protein
MPGDRSTDAILKNFSESVFKLSDPASLNTQLEFTLNILMVQVLVSLDGKKNISRIYQDTQIPMDRLRDSVAKLVEQGLIESVQRGERVLDKAFFDTLTMLLARTIGPISSILVDEAVLGLRLDRTHFPVRRVAELIGVLSNEVQQTEKRLDFQKNMIKLLKERGYIKGKNVG